MSLLAYDPLQFGRRNVTMVAMIVYACPNAYINSKLTRHHFIQCRQEMHWHSFKEPRVIPVSSLKQWHNKTRNKFIGCKSLSNVLKKVNCSGAVSLSLPPKRINHFPSSLHVTSLPIAIQSSPRPTRRTRLKTYKAINRPIINIILDDRHRRNRGSVSCKSSSTTQAHVYLKLFAYRSGLTCRRRRQCCIVPGA